MFSSFRSGSNKNTPLVEVDSKCIENENFKGKSDAGMNIQSNVLREEGVFLELL